MMARGLSTQTIAAVRDELPKHLRPLCSQRDREVARHFFELACELIAKQEEKRHLRLVR